MITPAATVAQAIVSSLGITGAAAGKATAHFTAVVQAIQDSIKAGTITINTGATATGAMGGGPGVPVTGTATIT